MINLINLQEEKVGNALLVIESTPKTGVDYAKIVSWI